MIEQGIQTNFPDERIRKWGCYFLCLVRWAQSITGEDFPVDKICAERDKAEKEGYLDEEMTILYGAEILKQLTKTRRFDIATALYHEPYIDRYIACLKKPGYTHFVFVHNGEKWDPLDPNRPAAAQYEVDSYRVII